MLTNNNRHTHKTPAHNFYVEVHEGAIQKSKRSDSCHEYVIKFVNSRLRLCNISQVHIVRKSVALKLRCSRFEFWDKAFAVK